VTGGADGNLIASAQKCPTRLSGPAGAFSLTASIYLFKHSKKESLGEP